MLRFPCLSDFWQTHLAQVENDYKDKLDKEVSMRRQAEKVQAFLISLSLFVCLFMFTNLLITGNHGMDGFLNITMVVSGAL